MHSISEQHRKSSTPTPLMNLNSLQPVSLLQIPPSLLHYSSINMKSRQQAGGNRRLNIAHRHQPQLMTNSRHQPYQFRPLLPSKRSFHSVQPCSPTPLMGISPGISQAEYERNHSVQVQRNKDKHVRHSHTLLPTDTTPARRNAHHHPTSNSSASTTANQSLLPSDQSANTEIMQYIDSSLHDIYYQCRYERYIGFSRTALLNEVLSLCTSTDRLQHEKIEIEKRLREVQKYVDTSLQQSNRNQGQRKTEDEINNSNNDLQSKQEINQALIEKNSSGNSS